VENKVKEKSLKQDSVIFVKMMIAGRGITKVF
jgi:hypothetical protein